MAFQQKTWADVPDEQNPPVPNPPRTEAAEFNRLEKGIADAHSHLAESLSAHGGVLIYVGASTAPPANPPTGLIWYQTDGAQRDLRNIGTSAVPVWEDVTRDKLVASDLVTDYVIRGLLPAAPSPQSLTASVPAGAAYVVGRRVAKTAQSLTFAKAQDTYVDLNRDGAYVLSPVANGAAAPVIAANAVRLFRAVTDADRAQVDTVTVATVANGAVYTVRINGVDVSYTSDATATAGEIALGLVAAINASTDPNVTPVTAATAALATDATATLTITADTAGVAFTATVSANLTVANTTANNTAKITAIADLRTMNPTVRGAASAGGVTSLDGLSDVDTTTTPPTGGQALVFQSSSGLWLPGSVAGGGEHKFARKTADTARASTATVSSDPHLAISLDASQVWAFEMVLFYTGATSGDLRYTFTLPTGATMRWGAQRIASDATALPANVTQGIVAGVAVEGSAGTVGTASDVMLLVKGIVVMSTTVGALQVQWAQLTADATATTVRADSHIIAHRVA